MQLDQRECEQTYFYVLRACSHHCHPVTQLKCNTAKAPPSHAVTLSQSPRTGQESRTEAKKCDGHKPQSLCPVAAKTQRQRSIIIVERVLRDDHAAIEPKSCIVLGPPFL